MLKIKTLFFDCHMGAAGDMLMAALLELSIDPQNIISQINYAGIPGVTVTSLDTFKYGIKGTSVTVKVNDTYESELNQNEPQTKYMHAYSNLHTIESLIQHLSVSDFVRHNTLAVYKIIADAESHAHNQPVDMIHFHEVGAMDAVADIVGVCMLVEELSPDVVMASPVHVGSGQVHCAHGWLPVPAPATTYILHGVPIYGGEIKGELCTPTGAALLKHFVSRFGDMPVLTVTKIGYGMGKKDFERINGVRAIFGHTQQTPNEVGATIELACNLDDMTPEAVSFTQQLLMDEGALDAFAMPIIMKKGRAGVLLNCLCRRDEADKFIHLVFKHTSTLGIRSYESKRYTLNRNFEQRETPYGSVTIKSAKGYGVEKSKPEYEDVANIARGNGLAFGDVLQLLK